MEMRDAIVTITGGKAEAIVATDAAIAVTPRSGQTAAQAAAEQAKLEVLKAKIEALP